jgi:catechol-2,3-dioxygenase
MTTAIAGLENVNLFAKDIDALSRFYGEGFGFSEISARTTDIYRLVVAGTVELGFNRTEPTASWISMAACPTRADRQRFTALSSFERTANLTLL